MFIEKQSRELIDEYKRKLQAVGLLSKLFSEKETPYLPYRIAENLFCDVFSAVNHSRSDNSADAAIGVLGFGIKTFTANSNTSLQKIAEFDRLGPNLLSLKTRPEELARELARIRNERIEYAKNVHGLDELIYHLIARREGEFQVVEENMDIIDSNTIRLLQHNTKSIRFSDSLNEYSFYFSKSTLLKRFDISSSVLSIDISIHDNPFDLILALVPTEEEVIPIADIERLSVILPMYSPGEENIVPEKSGLNQWNARGRRRDSREIYIPIPHWIHDSFPGFFPARDQPFTLNLPNNRTLSVKVCQDNDKALMSNPNKDLGEWLLGEVLSIPPNELVTYDKLLEIGIDSVMVTKIDSRNFEIDFKRVGSYEQFKEDNDISIEEG